MTRRSVGGAARGIASSSVGSSPSVSIKATSMLILRGMLRNRDRWLCKWDMLHKRNPWMFHSQSKETMRYRRWDVERRAIREKIKARWRPSASTDGA